MRTSVERLRIGLLAGAGLLVVVLAGFLGYARYKVHRALVELPGRMGATITKEFNGWTYSQSDGKKTVFTIHAAKAVQHTDGTLTLHDVSMILYGKKGDRADRISGDEFEYDTKEEVIRARGIVHLDLAAPVAEGARTSDAAKHLDSGTVGGADGGAAGVAETREDAGAGSRVVHIKTSGLVYLKKLGIAATKEGIEFAFGGFTGHAVGAEYDSDTGHVVLQSALTVSGLDKGKPIAITASHGELDRAQNVAEFNDARYSSAGEVARADVARLHMRADGSLERIVGERHVSLEEAGGGSVTSDQADVALDAKSKPETAVLTGNVHFVEDDPLRQTRGDSERANLRFNGQGHVDHALLDGKVRTSEVMRRIQDDVWAQPESARRELQADSLELWLVTDVSGECAAGGPGGKTQLRDAKATGAARMSSVARDAKDGGITTTKLAGDLLLAHFVPRNGLAELSTVHGAGHTVVEQTSTMSGEQKSEGETLEASFRASAKGRGAVELANAVQQGGVVIDRSVPAKKAVEGAASARPEVQHATAAKAAFDADTGKLTLSGDPRTGDVRMRDSGSELSAARVAMDRDSGDATADGSVKVSYLQASPAEPVHVSAARAELNHDAGRATFYGRALGGGGLARMWQAGAGGQGVSQVEAPVLVFEQEQRRLTAKAETARVADSVHAVLASAPAANVDDADGARAKSATQPLKKGVARITSSLMVYSDLARQAEFSGGVKVLDGSGEMRAEQATVFLRAASAGKASKTAGATTGAAPGTAVGPGSNLTGLFGGSVERIVATHRIEITQPGREATGERLVYTASDQMFVLTGTAAAPPKVVDATQGTTTGAMLRFHSGDDSVVVSGIDGEGPARRVRTETSLQKGANAPTGTMGQGHR